MIIDERMQHMIDAVIKTCVVAVYPPQCSIRFLAAAGISDTGSKQLPNRLNGILHHEIRGQVRCCFLSECNRPTTSLASSGVASTGSIEDASLVARLMNDQEQRT